MSGKLKIQQKDRKQSCFSLSCIYIFCLFIHSYTYIYTHIFYDYLFIFLSVEHFNFIE